MKGMGGGGMPGERPSNECVGPCFTLTLSCSSPDLGNMMKMFGGGGAGR